MIKPKILSDETLHKFGLWEDMAMMRRAAQAQNDYCYKEMVRQFREFIDSIDKRHTVSFVIQALQGLEGETNSTGTLCLGANRGEPKDNDNKSF